MPSSRPLTQPLIQAALVALASSGCVVSFDGYHLDESDAGVGGASGAGAIGGAGAQGGAGGASGSGAQGGTSGSAGATGGNGGSAGAGAGGVAGSSGGAGGVAGSTGGVGGNGGVGGVGGNGGTGGTPVNCPGDTATGLMIKNPVGSYCIDQTEVTNAQYAGFLGASGSKPNHPSCGANADFDPGATTNCNYDPVGKASYPVVCIDWCDAWAYCNFVGKKLCGRTGTTPLLPSETGDATKSQWFDACSNGGTKTYPYGNVYNANTCNGSGSGGVLTKDVSEPTGCVGGFALLFHMSGNVREWENACEGSNCASRGGGYLDSNVSSPESLHCNSAPLVGRMTKHKERGFRCCADLP